MDGDSQRSMWDKLTHLFGKAEDNLEQAIMEARDEGDVEAEESNMLLSILELGEKQVQEIMTPRTDITCLASETTIQEAARCILDNGHSRIPVYKDTKDNIIGIIYAKDLLTYLVGNNHNFDDHVNKIMRQPFFIPETKISAELLQEFRSRKNHIAIVVDEYGGTSGLITIEDLLEVIVGDIEDEFDAPKEEDIQKITDEQYLLHGRAMLDDLNDIDIPVSSDEVDTIGGYLSLQAGHVPLVNEEFAVGEWKFTVIEADTKQIHKISAQKITEQTLEDE
ncbi:MAG: hemolysin family protein [Mailhella sp.]|nr:hemolysin family protein [Mailhella sp.]